MEDLHPPKFSERLASGEAAANLVTKLLVRPNFLKGIEGVIDESIEYSKQEAALKESRRFENDQLFYDDNPLAQRLILPFGAAQPRQDPTELPLLLGRLIIRRQQRTLLA